MENNPTIYSICGPSGSGKSTVSDKVKEIDPENVCIINEDSFYIPLEKDEDPSTHNFDDPKSIDWQLFNECVEELKNGKETVVPIYDFVTHSRVGSKKITPKKLILIEGILLFTCEQIRKYSSLLIYVDAEQVICFIRRMERDIKERGRTIESVIKQYTEQVLPAFKDYIEPSSRYANITIHNTLNNDYTGMETFIKLCKIVLN